MNQDRLIAAGCWAVVVVVVTYVVFLLQQGLVIR